MGYKPKIVISFSPIEHLKIGLWILAGFLISITFLSPSVFFSFPLSNSSLRSLSMNITASPNQMKDVSKLNYSGNLHDSNDVILNVSHLNKSYASEKKVADNFTIKSDVTTEAMKPLCEFSNRRSNICDMHGDIRIHGKSSSVISVTTTQRNESYTIRPYARKTDLVAMKGVTELTVKTSNIYDNASRCSLNYNAPAIIFSVSGYTGNYFHDFTDVLVPLFLTSYQFNGEVYFLVSNFRSWWINKYHAIFKNLSRYEIIDLDHDDKVHCFKHAIVGLNSHDDMRIDTSKSPNGYSMIDFTKFLRNAYSLQRDGPIMIMKNSTKKPRLFIVARSRTRKFINLDEIVEMAKNLGYEVVVGEAEPNVEHFAHIVNTCDVMLGVHGAGLTNLVFLPTNAILIQIVPRGLDWISRKYFDEPSKGMNLKYLDYKISVEESSLVELYPKDHIVVQNPMATFLKFGMNFANDVYLFKQNVKLNVTRFRPVLINALEFLHEN